MIVGSDTEQSDMLSLDYSHYLSCLQTQTNARLYRMSVRAASVSTQLVVSAVNVLLALYCTEMAKHVLVRTILLSI